MPEPLVTLANEAEFAEAVKLLCAYQGADPTGPQAEKIARRVAREAVHQRMLHGKRLLESEPTVPELE
ncbi:MAG: hypothetical protein KGL39_38220 [Patescibacteria group bacterium]|nr:hypothetical protein [Patescibacteria group bacterium]